jgi:hypothetical protein
MPYKLENIQICLFRYWRVDPLKLRHVGLDETKFVCCGCKVVNLKSNETVQGILMKQIITG